MPSLQNSEIVSSDTTLKPVMRSTNMVFQDNRGSLHSLKSFEFRVKEVLVSHSYPGVVRGLHWSPYRKHIYVSKGKIYDFWFVPETQQVFEGVLSTGESMIIPPNAMHGFYAIEEVDMLYFLEQNFDPAVDKGYYWASPGLPLKLDFPRTNLIVSQKDDSAPYFHQVDYLLLGATGYLGSFTEQVLKDQAKTYLVCKERLENIATIENMIRKSGCKYVICAAGISGRPTTAWCETHEKETYQVNYLQMCNLMELTDRLKVHLTIYGTGLLYQPDPTKAAFTESDKPDLDNSVYVRYRVELESHLKLYPNVLCLRILYPVTCDGHEKCFMTKMLGRTSSVHNVSVAVTVVPDLFPTIPKLVESGTVGPLNFVNTGVISLPDLLQLFDVEHTVTDPTPKPGVVLSTDQLSKASGRPIPSVTEALQALKLGFKEACKK